MSTLIFLKLGGSLITNKARRETVRRQSITRLAVEVRDALAARPDLALVIGHGSGSFGHSAAQQYGTYLGVKTRQDWEGFAAVSVIAARLNHIILELFAPLLPVFRVQPSASAVCEDGALVEMAVEPIRHALAAGLVPLIYGDVAVDRRRGGVIVSTEQVFSYLASELNPQRILLAGDYDGVMNAQRTEIISLITSEIFPAVRSALMGSAHPDVTGGMASKVESMLALCKAIPGLSVHIFSGRGAGEIYDALIDDTSTPGTRITAKPSDV